MKKIGLLSLILAGLLSSCAIIRPGEVGVRSTFGKLKGPVKTEGMIVYNAFATRVIKIPTRTINRELKINLPSKEGLTIQSEISILYHIKGEKAKELIQETPPTPGYQALVGVTIIRMRLFSGAAK